MQYVELPIADKALITTTLAVNSYKETWEKPRPAHSSRKASYLIRRAMSLS